MRLAHRPSNATCIGAAGISVCGALLTLSLLTSAPAEACGGFFCSQAAPVNQAAERIIFSKNQDGTVTAVVQILYQGPSQKFSWVLPVPSVPQVGVSSNTAFTRLQAVTNPSYVLKTTVDGTCKQDQPVGFLNAVSGPPTAGADGAPGPTGDVVVVEQGTVGPYDYQVIQVDATLADKAQVAVDWLQQNGYDVTAIAPALLRSYFDNGDLLLAFRLTKSAMTGDIRPVILTFNDDRPMIPIKLTAVSTQDNMGVMVWVLGEHRAIPTNYRSLELNDAAINWFSAASSYAAVINLAADEAGGQGFVTEYAQASAGLAGVVLAQFESDRWAQLKAQDWAGQMAQLRSALSSFTYPAFDGTADVLSDFSNKDDPAGLVAAFDTRVMKPMADTQALLTSRPYVTRFYSTLSAPEMTVDPEFDFNPDLADVSNQHNATQVVSCNPWVYRQDAIWRVTLPSGRVVFGSGFTWPFTPGSNVPANIRISQLSTSGTGDVVKDNSAPVQQAVDTSNRRVRGCGCSSGEASIGFMVMVAALALRGWGRRRR